MSTKKSALGKGLSALLEGNINPVSIENAGAPVESLGGPAKVMPGNVALIQLSQIEANPFQPRTEFDESALKELAESIQTQGIIQPITVRKMGPDRYQIISGERR